MAWLDIVESAGNHLLALDPQLLEQLTPYYGKTFRIELIEPNYSIDMRACPDGFILQAADDSTPEVTLRGSLWAFGQLAKQGTHSDVFEKGRITMSGDAELGQSFQQVLASMQIDWEELTSKFVGDMAARNLHRVFGSLSSWFDQSAQNFKQNSSEIIREELKLTPSKVEVEVMNDEVEALRADVARLEARFTKLKATLDQTNNHADA